jgi:hypothetical protein
MTEVSSIAAPTPPHRRRRLLLSLVPLLALAVWLGYVWWVSTVIVATEQWPDRTIRAEGYLKRSTLFGGYKRHGAWTFYHPNGRKSAEGRFDLGVEVGHWDRWDETGRPIEAASPQSSVSHSR